jgi:SAM-dependent methyltransferase
VNPYPDRFLRLLDQHPGARVLDCGSGGRSHPRVVSVEYIGHRNNSVQADVHHLPFRDASFDLVLSQATLEHVHTPQQAVNEMVRVTRPGGLLYIEVAFMQPLHQEPWHYFNMTPSGLAHLLGVAGVSIKEAGTVPTSVVDQFAWILRDIGAEDVWDIFEWDQVMGLLGRIDERGDPAARDRVASGVYALARVS